MMMMMMMMMMPGKEVTFHLCKLDHHLGDCQVEETYLKEEDDDKGREVDDLIIMITIIISIIVIIMIGEYDCKLLEACLGLRRSRLP